MNNPINLIDPTGTNPVAGALIGIAGVQSTKTGTVPAAAAKTATKQVVGNPTTASRSLVEFICGYEAFHPTVYDDGYGNPTIAFGHLVKEGEKFGTLTRAEGLDLFARDIAGYESQTTKWANEIGIVWDQNQYDAFVSLTYNSWSSSETVMKKIVGGMDPFDAFGLIVNVKNKNTGLVEVSPGLVKRRKAEANIFVYGIYNSSH